jgi:hypothetical protein
LRDVAAARARIDALFPAQTYPPRDGERWAGLRRRFAAWAGG